MNFTTWGRVFFSTIDLFPHTALTGWINQCCMWKKAKSPSLDQLFYLAVFFWFCLFFFKFGKGNVCRGWSVRNSPADLQGTAPISWGAPLALQHRARRPAVDTDSDSSGGCKSVPRCLLFFRSVHFGPTIWRQKKNNFTQVSRDAHL